MLEFEAEFAQFDGGGAVVEGGDDVLGGAAQLEQPVLQVGQLPRREDDGVFGQSPALHGGAAFVGALPAWLRAVAAGPADAHGADGVVGQASAAPGAVAGRAARRCDPFGLDQRRALLVGGHPGIMPVGRLLGAAARRRVTATGWSPGCHVWRAHSTDAQ